MIFFWVCVKCTSMDVHLSRFNLYIKIMGRPPNLYGYLIIFALLVCVGCFETGNNENLRHKQSFQSVSFQAPDRGGRKCHDFCGMMPDLCRNGGTCVTDDVTCIGRCICAPNWTGKWCRDKIVTEGNDNRMGNLDTQENDTATVPNKIHVTGNVLLESDKPKKQELPNGIVNRLGSVLLTRRPPVTADPLLTPKQENSAVDNSVVANNGLSDRERDINLRKECMSKCNNGTCVNVDGEYKCKTRINDSDRAAPKVCAPGFECDHGVCDMEALESHSYRCICEDNYLGQFCSLKCPHDCGEHGHCDIHVTNNTYNINFKCFCDWNYTGLNCSELVPEDPEPLPPEAVIFHWYVVGVSVAIVIMVVTILVVAGYFMWRKRLVFVLKIVHYFQQYEDDDGKEYDAFISYKSCPRDEEFVLYQLYPKLERDFQFKLCMHFRDFLPGEAIANNIVRAIESSRRTIMILSPEYVKSEWCRMEYQKAQHEMLKLKHKIIPIVLEDISDVKSVDKNLKSILNSVTYLEWPGHENSKKTERFWKKLELSLPKKTTQKLSSNLSDLVPPTSPLPSSDLISSEIVSSPIPESPDTPLSIKLDNRQTTDSPTPSLDTASSSSPKFQRKRKNFKHFMDKLVQSKLFKRQDSNSSQAALVDEETLASRSSCGSVSESMLTESSEPPSPACSTPSTPSERRNSIGNAFFPVVSSVSVTKERFQQSFRKCKEISNVCEKDHCDDSECVSCKAEYDLYKQRTISQQFLNRGFVNDDETSADYECEYCKYANNVRSDNNRVKISAIEGSDQLKIQKLPARDSDACKYCDHVIHRNPYRGSMKHHKDLANELMRQTRVGSLPRNYKNSQILKSKATTTDNSTLSNSDSSTQQFYMDVCENV